MAVAQDDKTRSVAGVSDASIYKSTVMHRPLRMLDDKATTDLRVAASDASIDKTAMSTMVAMSLDEHIHGLVDRIALSESK